MMNSFICVTCGTEYPPSDTPPQLCPICSDDRQYVGRNGQQWTTLESMRERGFKNAFLKHEPGLYGIGTTPQFAIGQRAILARTQAGNVLWDCITYLDEATVDIVNALGGIDVIAISHPHYYTTMVEWAEAFDAKIMLHENDKPFVMYPSDRIEYWAGDSHKLSDETELLCLGGHFPGGTVLHYAPGAEGRGAILAGDILQVVADTRYVSFMYSYPNLIPLPAREVARIQAALEPVSYDRVYGLGFHNVISANAKAAVSKSADRYIQSLESH